MILVEKHIVSKNNNLYSEIDNLALKSKNLYNKANYVIRQSFINDKLYLNYNTIQKIAQDEKWDEYYCLPAKVSQQTLMLLDKNWKSFFKSIKDWGKHKSKYLGRPKLPKYKDVKSGRNIVIYSNQAISYKKEGYVKLSKTNIEIKTNLKNINQVRLIPRYGHYVVELVYEKQEEELKHSDNLIGIDLGVNNLCTITSNFDSPKIVNGKPLKSINQYFNKSKSDLQSKLKSRQFTSNRIEKLTFKRNNKINHYLHNVSKWIIDYCLTNNVSKIIIGKNVNWKQDVNLGSKTNQSFTQIPFTNLISMITYKAQLQGISIIMTEESYTSKCSFIDNEDICKHDDYLGKRVKRGLFRSKDKKLINADVNGSFNIIRKVIPEFSYEIVRNRGFVVNPKLVEISV